MSPKERIAALTQRRRERVSSANGLNQYSYYWLSELRIQLKMISSSDNVVEHWYMFADFRMRDETEKKKKMKRMKSSAQRRISGADELDTGRVGEWRQKGKKSQFHSRNDKLIFWSCFVLPQALRDSISNCFKFFFSPHRAPRRRRHCWSVYIVEMMKI